MNTIPQRSVLYASLGVVIVAFVILAIQYGITHQDSSDPVATATPLVTTVPATATPQPTSTATAVPTQAPTPATTPPSTSNGTGDISTVVTMAELASSNTPNNCYVSIAKRVYDITEYFPVHSTGNTLENGCGKEVDSLTLGTNFSGGSFTSSANIALLQPYLLGTLVQ